MYFKYNVLLLVSILQAQDQPWLRAQGEDRNWVDHDAWIIYLKMFLLGFLESTGIFTLFILQLSLQKESWSLPVFQKQYSHQGNS